MAKQNFLSGGYYGKLGQTVGQRWKNMRTIRAYVIPSDPRTPDQKKQRAKFGSGVFYAQIARQANSSCTLFKSESMTEWNKRVSVAIENKKHYNTCLSLLPLATEGTPIPFLINSGTYVYDIPTDTLEIEIAGILPDVGRKYSIIMTNDPETTSADEVTILSGETTDDDPYTIITSRLGAFEFKQTTKVRIVSRDDTDSEKDIVLSNEIVLQPSGVIQVPITLAAQSVQTVGNTTTLVFSNDYISGDFSAFSPEQYVQLNGNSVTGTYPVSAYKNVGGKMAIEFIQPDYSAQNQIAWGTGSEFSAAEVQILTATHRYYQINPQVIIAESPTPERELTSTLSELKIIDNKVSIKETSMHVSLFADRIGAVFPTECNGHSVSSMVWQADSIQTVGAVQTQVFAPPTTMIGAEGLKTKFALNSGTSTFTLGTRTVVINGVKYKLTPSSAVAVTSGKFAYNLAPVWTSQESTTKQLSLLSDIWEPSASSKNLNTTISYTTNGSGIRNDTNYANGSGYYKPSASNRLALEANFFTAQACISCYFKSQSFEIMNALAEYSYQATDSTLYYNTKTAVVKEDSNTWNAQINFGPPSSPPATYSPCAVTFADLKMYVDMNNPWTLATPSGADPYNYINGLYMEYNDISWSEDWQSMTETRYTGGIGGFEISYSMNDPKFPSAEADQFMDGKATLNRSDETTERLIVAKATQSDRVAYFVIEDIDEASTLVAELNASLSATVYFSLQ